MGKKQFQEIIEYCFTSKLVGFFSYDMKEVPDAQHEVIENNGRYIIE